MLRVVSPSLRAVRRQLVPTATRRLNAGAPWRRSLITTYYTKDHESISYDDGNKTGRVRITDYAQSSLGDVVFVELPTEGTEVKQGDQIGAVESVKAASDIYSPVSGTVLKINGDLDKKPGQLNSSNTETNWLCDVRLSDPSELEKLMSENDYKAHCETESS